MSIETPIVGQDRVDPVRHRFQQVFNELPCRSSFSLVDELNDREFTGAGVVDKQVELTFGGLRLGNIHVKEAARAPLEALSLRPFDFGQESLVAIYVCGWALKAGARWKRGNHL